MKSKTWETITTTLASQGITLPPEAITNGAKAFNSKNGQLQKTAPRGNPWALAVWIGCQPNPHKVPVGRLMLMEDEPKAVCLQLSQFAWPAALDPDMNALVRMGTW